MPLSTRVISRTSYPPHQHASSPCVFTHRCVAPRYKHMSPAKWDRWIGDTLGRHTPLFASFGHSRHDPGLEGWLATSAVAAGAECFGRPGRAMICWHNGLLIVSSSEPWHAAGSDAERRDVHGNEVLVGAWVARQLACVEHRRHGICVARMVASGIGEYDAGEYCTHKAPSPPPWVVCSWHSPMIGKDAPANEPGLSAAFSACRRAGAIVAGGHTHAYRRDYWHEHDGETHGMSGRAAGMDAAASHDIPLLYMVSASPRAHFRQPRAEAVHAWHRGQHDHREWPWRPQEAVHEAACRFSGDHGRQAANGCGGVPFRCDSRWSAHMGKRKTAAGRCV